MFCQLTANTGASPAQKQRTPKPNHELNKMEYVLNHQVVGCFVMKRKLTNTKVVYTFYHSLKGLQLVVIGSFFSCNLFYKLLSLDYVGSVYPTLHSLPTILAKEKKNM